ncbi:MAG: hypothetical protein NC299_03445 [Lachnospiraceae bacterium]|nr:hypothetical protein [Ruminococcus sp.]MCM1274404.1 hypothetical protein [Lachnospiraceae bacterium]
MKKRKKALPLPEGFTQRDIRLESSVCTGEKTIGFYSAAEKKLLFAELVRSEEDVAAFYEKYGLERSQSLS